MDALAGATPNGSVGIARQVRRASVPGPLPVSSARLTARFLFALSAHDTHAEHAGALRERSSGPQSVPNEMSQGATSWKQ